MPKKLLKLSAIIATILLAGIGLSLGSCAISDYQLQAKENERPLLKAMKSWQKQSGYPSNKDETSIVLQFIPIGTSADQAIQTLTQNGFTINTTQPEAMYAVYTKQGFPCRVDYTVLLEIKELKVTKTDGRVNLACL